MPTYSQENFERIAAALSVSTDKVLLHASEFETTATWYRLNVPPDKRQGGPTQELLNQRIKKAKGTSGLCNPPSKKSRTLSQLRKKADRVEAAARSLELADWQSY
jgi:hypothetical protein